MTPHQLLVLPEDMLNSMIDSLAPDWNDRPEPSANLTAKQHDKLETLYQLSCTSKRFYSLSKPLLHIHITFPFGLQWPGGTPVASRCQVNRLKRGSLVFYR